MEIAYCEICGMHEAVFCVGVSGLPWGYMVCGSDDCEEEALDIAEQAKRNLAEQTRRENAE